MAAGNYLRDLSEYLATGDLSDLTVRFGEKSWKTHKAIVCCHSKWFQKAVTGGFEETLTGVVILKDDPEFADAIDCMLSYFHKAAYNVTKYDKPQSLIHAQVAIIADKYDCGSLYELASTSYAITVKTIKSNDWAVIAGSIYDHTSNEIPSHVDLRSLIVPAVSCHYSLLKSIPQNESVINILRSNADLATDLLLYMMDSPKDRYGSERLAICTRCCYVHVGSPDCVKIVFGEFDKNYKICPKCGAGQKALLNEIYSCPSCGGIHNDA